MSGILSGTRSASPQKVHPQNSLAAGDGPNDKPALEGTIPFAVDGKTYQTWYKIYGDLAPSKYVPLVVVHGGPGMAHDYLIPVSDLQKTRPVIFYDQLGNGRSTRLPDEPKSFWTIDLFIDELANLISYLGIDSRYDILGHSWGDSSSPTPFLPCCCGTRATKPSFKRGPTEDKAKFRTALETHHSRHMCTLNPPPREVVSTFYDLTSGDKETGEGGDHTVYVAMHAGPLVGWNIVDGLHKINVPTLLLNGRDDIAQDFVVQPFFDGIARVKWLTFEKSSHVPMWEEREKFIEVVEHFLELDD